MKGFRIRKGLVLAFIAVLLAGITVYAVHDLGLFELDRNLNDSAGAGDDWSTLFNTNGTKTAGGSAIARSYVDDPFNSSSDDTFTQGASDQLLISGWHWTAGNANDKSDIKNAMAAAYVYNGPNQGSCVGQPAPCRFAQTGDLIIYYGLDRYANNGDGNVGFWFFKNPVGLNPDGTFSGEHAIGDLLLVSDFTNGGVISDVNGYVWVGSGGDTAGTLQQVFRGQDCDFSPAGGDLACAVVTKASPYQPTYFPFTAKFTDSGQPANTYPPGSFFEGGVNLSRFGIGPCFSGFMAQTRSSQSVTSSLQDLALGTFDLCHITATKVGDPLSKVGDPAHYVITITNDGGITLYKDDVTDSKGGVFFHDGVQTSNADLLQHNLTNFSTNCGVFLVSGASCTITYDYTVQQGDADPLVNSVGIIYRANSADVINNGAGVQAISTTAQHSTNLFQPSVAVKKCFNTLTNFDDACTTTNTAVIGSSVTYNFWIKNTSSSDAPNLVKDTIQDLLPNNSNHLVLTPPAACNNLAPGATCFFQVQHTLDANDFPSVTDNFVVHYHPSGFPNDIQGSTTATLTTTGISTTGTTLHKADHSVVGVGGHVALGTIMHDSATVTQNPASGPAPTGNVNFRFYTSSSDCTNDTAFIGGTTMGSVPLSSGVAHPSSSTVALTPGTYAFKAKWDGDSKYSGSTSACETFIVDKATLQITTQVHNTSHQNIENTTVVLNSVTHDTAHVTGSVSGFAIPAISFTLTSNYTGTCAAGAAVALDGTDAGNTDPRSVDSAALTPGAYAYRALVASDSNYDGATSACEAFSVAKANTTIVTVIHNGDPATDVAAGNVSSVVAGSTVHDKATVSGQVDGIVITGNVTFTWFTASDQCTGASVGAGTVALVNGVAHPSSSFGPLPAGLRSFRATYNGDTNYNASTGGCEPLTISLASSAIATDIHDDSGTHVALPFNPDKGTSIFHDSARLTTTSGQAPTGTVTFVFFNNGTCTGSPVDNSGALGLTQANANGGSVDATNYTKNPATGGNYAFRASYSGDPFNAGAIANCEPFTVTSIEIRKISNGGNDSFDFTLDDAPKTIVTSGFSPGKSPGQGTTGAVVVTAGEHVAIEVSKAGWALDSTLCAPRSGAATSPSASQNPTLQAGDAEVCVFTNTRQNDGTYNGATRTQGFWATHTVYANEIWNTFVVGSGYDNLCSTKIITAIDSPDQNILMGGFWANVANKTTNPKARTDVEKARMQVLQQYLAAVLNLKAFGTSDGGVINAARVGYCSNDADVVKQSIGPLGNYNTFGDSVPIDKVVGATPQDSRSQANIPYWDVTK